ncbi:hypothetical protein [Methanocella conradii]|uniref:hypothetical protein n=1 Tax=Methanocella conradii TaxID=1175444 RepID=UPI00157D0DA2|nr:hypothetical protein [Methanocella conradii]
MINGAFSTYLYINYPVELTLSAVDSTGTLRTMSLCLDGDQLPEKAEKLYGFDPLNPDSDSKLTAKNESGNGVVDGMEIAHNGVFCLTVFWGGLCCGGFVLAGYQIVRERLYNGGCLIVF